MCHPLLSPLCREAACQYKVHRKPFLSQQNKMIYYLTSQMPQSNGLIWPSVWAETPHPIYDRLAR